MELDVLFWLAIAAIYILQSIASKRRQPSGPVPEQAGDSAREMPPDLQEALGEIGRVLRGDPFEPQPNPGDFQSHTTSSKQLLCRNRHG